MEEKTIKIYPSNWLMAAGIVGFAKIFGNDYMKDNHVEIPKNFITDIFTDRFSNYVSEMNNAYGIIGDFYNNSPFAQVWQKSMKNTLIELGVDKTKAEKYEKFASDKKIANSDTFLKNINSILKKLKRPQVPHQKFLDIETVDNAIRVFEENFFLSPKITELSKMEKLAELPENIREDFDDLVNALECYLKNSNILQQKIKEVADCLVAEYEEDDLKCSFCSERKAIRRFDRQEGKKLSVVLDEKHFTPLGASAVNLANLYWEGNPTNFLCLPCELIIYCAAFGFTKAGKRYVFINAPTTIKEIVEINKIWADYIGQGKDRAFKDSLIEILKRMERAKAKWTLQNISFIELSPYSENTFNIHSFNIPVETANAVRKMIQGYPNKLKDVYDIFIDNIYGKKPLYDMVGGIVYGYLNKERLKTVADNNLQKSSIGRLVLSGKYLKNPKDLLFFLKFQKEVEEYGQ